MENHPNEPDTIEEILFYWAEREVMLELLSESGGAWRVYAVNANGTEHGGCGDMGCHSDVTYIVRVAHWNLRHRGLPRENHRLMDEPLFPYPKEERRPEAEWYKRGKAGEAYRKMKDEYVLDRTDPESERCLAEIKESLRSGKPVPPRENQIP